MHDSTGLVTASPAVNLNGVKPELIAFAQHLAVLHGMLFGLDLVITSGKDSEHVAGSLHAQGLALDLRVKDLDAGGQMLFLAVLNYAAPDNHIAVFDERALPGAPHLHIEYHGQ